LCNFILVFLRVFCGLNTLFKIPTLIPHQPKLGKRKNSSYNIPPSPSATTCTYRFHGPLSWLSDFWGWGAHRAQLRCPNDVSDDIYKWAWSTRRSLKPEFYKLPRPWSLWGSSPARENSHHRTENRTWDLMVSSNVANIN
jgi:hypothetical protein